VRRAVACSGARPPGWRIRSAEHGSWRYRASDRAPTCLPACLLCTRRQHQHMVRHMVPMVGGPRAHAPHLLPLQLRQHHTVKGRLLAGRRPWRGAGHMRTACWWRQAATALWGQASAAPRARSIAVAIYIRVRAAAGGGGEPTRLLPGPRRLPLPVLYERLWGPGQGQLPLCRVPPQLHHHRWAGRRLQPSSRAREPRPATRPGRGAAAGRPSHAAVCASQCRTCPR
jgi:hypothetical protein